MNGIFIRSLGTHSRDGKLTGMAKTLKVVIAGGGTGGHIIPALAIADELKAVYGAEMLFVGTPRGLESRLVPQAGYPLKLIEVGQLKNVSLLTRARTLLDLPLSLVRCRALLREFAPDAVVGVGGYASGPAMGAAVLSGIPTLAFEPNAFPGLANRLVGKRVSAAAVNFAPAAKYFRNAEITGIPVRKEFFALRPRPVDADPHLLVFGGSQGARALNNFVPRIAAGLLSAVPGLTILHQACGGYAGGLPGERCRSGAMAGACVSGRYAAALRGGRPGFVPQWGEFGGGAGGCGQAVAAHSFPAGGGRSSAQECGGAGGGRRRGDADRGESYGGSPVCDTAGAAGGSATAAGDVGTGADFGSSRCQPAHCGDGAVDCEVKENRYVDFCSASACEGQGFLGASARSRSFDFATLRSG